MKIQNEKIEGLYKAAYLHMRYAELVLQYDPTLTGNQQDHQLKTRDRQHDRQLAFLESLYALNYFLDDPIVTGKQIGRAHV